MIAINAHTAKQVLDGVRRLATDIVEAPWHPLAGMHLRFGPEDLLD